MAGAPKGRAKRFAIYEDLEARLPEMMSKRPIYAGGVGLFRGERGTTVWLKLWILRPTSYRGASLRPGQSKEIKLGAKASWPWDKVEAELDKLKGRAERGEPLDDVRDALFSEYAEEWLARKKPALKGWGVTAGHVRKHLKPTFGAKALTTIARADVNKWIAAQLAENKPATVQRQLNTLKAILNDAVRNGLLPDNPVRFADTIRGVEGRQRVLDHDELEAVYQTAERVEAETINRTTFKGVGVKGWLRDFVLWAVHSGMRRQEILNLRFGNFVELPEGVVIAIVERSKSGKPRQVACSSEMIAIRERMKTKRRDENDDRLFPVSLTTVKRSLTRVWKTCGLEDARLHDLRRTHASELIRGGTDLRTVADRIGHRDLSMLEKHYAIPLGQLEAAKAAQRIFGGGEQAA